MNKITLRFVLVGGLGLALLFGFYPALDLSIAHLFYNGSFAFALSPFTKFMRQVGIYLPVCVALFALFNLFTKRFDVRISYFLLTSGLIAPILIVNLLLKEHWHRARPVQILEFGGKFDFTPWYEMGSQCAKNCSFVSGEASGVFWLLGVAAVLPMHLRKLGYVLILAFACFISILRMSFGGHFFSDVAFAAIITYVVLYLLHYIFFPELRHETKN